MRERERERGREGERETGTCLLGGPRKRNGNVLVGWATQERERVRERWRPSAPSAPSAPLFQFFFFREIVLILHLSFFFFFWKKVVQMVQMVQTRINVVDEVNPFRMPSCCVD